MGNKHNEQNPPPFHLSINNGTQPGQIYDFYSNQKGVKSNLSQKNTNQINNIAMSQKNGYNNSFKKEEGKKEKEKIKKRENYSYIEDNISIDIDIINKNKVNVKIPVGENSIWEKEYENNQLIGEIIKDYTQENKLKLPSDFFNDLRCFKYKVSMKDKISTLLPIDEESEINEFQKKNINEKVIDLSHLDEKYTEIMGKPFNNPFEILCFYKNERKFRKLNYNDEIIKAKNLDKFDKTSAYCNGWNHLYISGGSNSLNQLWDINLKKNSIHSPIHIPQKKNHSMIFIPKHIIFIVGGNNLDTYYYNLKEKCIVTWGNLNSIRVEPALQLVNKKLYCIDSIINYNNYTLEATDLISNEAKWILIKPKISSMIINSQIMQKEFAICKDKDNIIFLGGQINNINGMKNNIMNLIYNKDNNCIELSEVKYKQFKLKEKGFSPFNNIYDFILTDFPRDSPQMAFFNKKKKKIEIINFSSDDILIKEQNINEIGKNQNSNTQNNFKNNLDNISKISSITFGKNSNKSPRFINEDLNKEAIHFYEPEKKVNKINLVSDSNKNITNSNFTKLTNQNQKLNNIKFTNNITNITPINYKKNNNIVQSNINNINKRAPINYYKNYNTINNKAPINYYKNYNNNIYSNINNNSNNNTLNNLNYNYIKRENNGYINFIQPAINIPNYTYYYQVPIVNNLKTVAVLSKTPDKNYNNYGYSYTLKNVVNYVQGNSSHSYDSTKKRYYLPRGRVNAHINRNNNYNIKYY